MPHYLPLAGALLGYLLLMWSNPVRASLRDGFLTVKRYPGLAGILGLFGFGHALFQLWLAPAPFGLAPAVEPPVWLWTREGWWHLPADTLHDAAREAVPSMLESTAGLFNVLVTTYPLAALAALLFLLNWGGHQTALWRALRRRCGRWAFAAHGGILLCAMAALCKPALYALPRYLSPQAWIAWNPAWFTWSPVIEWIAFLFEYLFGVAVQIYLLCLAYCWVRGLSFRHGHLREFTIRRFSFVLRWAAVVMILSTVFINLPLMLQNAPLFARWFAASTEAIEHRDLFARMLLSAVFLIFATVQITLMLHNESLRQSVRDHFRFARGHVWPLSWFILIAALHFFLLAFGDGIIRSALGAGTISFLLWSLIMPWLFGAVGAWLLASWVSVFKRADANRLHDRDWVQF